MALPEEGLDQTDSEIFSDFNHFVNRECDRILHKTALLPASGLDYVMTEKMLWSNSCSEGSEFCKFWFYLVITEKKVK